MAGIIVYGGGFAGVAAAAKAASKAPKHEVVLISPYPDDMLGGIGTSGGQNYWDTYAWPQGRMTARGSFAFWHDTYPLYYGVGEMSKLLKADSLGKYGNVSVYTGYDICSYKAAGNPNRIVSVTARKIYRDADGFIKWGQSPVKFIGAVFVDASEEGRLARIVNAPVTTGRYDWPSSRLDAAERGKRPVARQQAATLMFKMKGINAKTSGDMRYSQSAKGVWGCWGGTGEYKAPNGPIAAFNNKHAPSGYMIKPVNAAQDGANSPQWWINAFLVFNVDGRAHSRDEGSDLYPSDMLAGTKNTDQAWSDARRYMHANRAEIECAMRSYPGFEGASIVYSGGYPEVGSTLYIRETVHMPGRRAAAVNGVISAGDAGTAGNSGTTGNSGTAGGAGTAGNAGTAGGSTSSSGIINGLGGSGSSGATSSSGSSSSSSAVSGDSTEDQDYAVGTTASLGAGPGPSGGADAAYHATRVGLAMYAADIHPYKYTDLKKGAGYLWGAESWEAMRPDRPVLNPERPQYPVYLPYSCITTEHMANLLLPGYAAGASSYAWGELRVLPNLCVLGDAAGVAAAYSLNMNVTAYEIGLSMAHINAVQNDLLSIGARLDK